MNSIVAIVIALVIAVASYPPFRFDGGGPDPAGTPPEPVPPPDPSPLAVGRR